MRRTVFNTLCTLLLLAGYLWGGCVSCEQFFMAPGSDGHCCQAGKCKRPAQQTQQDCETMPLIHVWALDSHSQIAVAFADRPLQIVDAGYQPLNYFDPVAYSPPDLRILNASLLI